MRGLKSRQFLRPRTFLAGTERTRFVLLHGRNLNAKEAEVVASYDYTPSADKGSLYRLFPPVPDAPQHSDHL